ncbi:unnamed protein product [Peronospora belbahrii]|uniref:Alternative oxidase n=1 Tax=Peronospora belbahrii TaxID=622444 RepID=A0AAU9L7J7_9STRA|nr:unnamed protein product [Peronospora belbahrii]CAH0516606.1 unnamed protein product [Peronospora belbahrii]
MIAIKPLHRCQATRVLTRQLFPFSLGHVSANSTAVQPTPSSPNKTKKRKKEEKTEIHPEPVDATSEPAYKAHFLESNNVHPLRTKNPDGEPVWDNPIRHPIYDLDKIATVEQIHHPITKMHDRVALVAVKALRKGFDVMSGYRGPGGSMSEGAWLNRCLFLESVAGVPGMVGGMLRHLRSLRLFKRDYGWIHTLLEEAENERMHLLIFMNLKQPGYFFRALVAGAQGVFFNTFFLTYLVSSKTCHRFVGYLEEEAVRTYTHLLEDIENGHMGVWKQKKAPLIAQTYYKLPQDASVYDMVKCIRADECHHRDTNHTFANLDQKKGVSPFVNRQH